MNRALTRSRPVCVRVLNPARVGLNVTVVLPDMAKTLTVFFSLEPAAGPTTSVPPPATVTFTVSVPLRVFTRPF